MKKLWNIHISLKTIKSVFLFIFQIAISQNDMFRVGDFCLNDDDEHVVYGNVKGFKLIPKEMSFLHVSRYHVGNRQHNFSSTSILAESCIDTLKIFVKEILKSHQCAAELYPSAGIPQIWKEFHPDRRMFRREFPTPFAAVSSDIFFNCFAALYYYVLWFGVAAMHVDSPPAIVNCPIDLRDRRRLNEAWSGSFRNRHCREALTILSAQP